jgi:hypothetical protein
VSEEAKLIEHIAIRVITDVSGDRHLSFSFSDLEDSEPSAEEFKSDENEKTVSHNAFVRPSFDSESLSKAFKRLSNQWTTTAIGFFEVVPELARRNFDFVGSQMTDEVAAEVVAMASSSETHDLDDGSVVNEYKIPIKDFPLIALKMGKTATGLKAVNIMTRASLVALVSEYEAFLFSVLREIARLRPDVFVGKDETINVLELEGYSSYQSFFSDIIDRKIENLFHSSHFEVLEWIENKFSVNLTSNDDLILDFIEVCQRRNLLTHGMGIANRKYIENCRRKGKSSHEAMKREDKIVVDRRYLRKATSVIYQVGYFTLHLLWQKLLATHREDSYTYLLINSHDFLENDLTKMCSRVCNFALVSKEHMSDRTAASLTINSALSVLFDPSIEDGAVRKEMVAAELRKRKDWSMVSSDVALALACVNRDYGQLDALTERAVKDGLSHIDARTWSVFREVRSREEFCKHFEKL